MSDSGARVRRDGASTAIALLLLAASPALGGAAAPAAPAPAPPEARIDPLRLLTVGLSEAEILEADTLGQDPSKFRIWATMKAFRMTSGPRISTDRAELEASFVPAPPVGRGEVFVNRPLRVYGHLRVFGEGDQAVDWYFEPANFADWSPHVTYDRRQSRVTIIAPVALVDLARTHRVPILLGLNCRPAGDKLDCYSAGSVFEQDNAARRALPNDPVDALGLHWGPRHPSETGSDAEAPASRR